MNETARDAARSADVVVFVTDVAELGAQASDASSATPLTVHPSDVALLADIGRDQPTVLVVNKVDRVRDKRRLLPLLSAFAELREFAAIIPVCARRCDGLDVVLDEIAKLCPKSRWQFGADDMTDRPTRFFAGEYIREQILRATDAEVPHAVAVTIDRFVEPATSRADPRPESSVSNAVRKRASLAVHIDATIHVERNGQKRILIGTAGGMLKSIGTQARIRIEELLGQKVNLKLWVRVDPAWRQSARELEEMGYGRPSLAETMTGAAGTAGEKDVALPSEVEPNDVQAEGEQ
jgi:GTP-binding protein Era